MNRQPQPPVPTRRRWYQFSLRTFIGVVVVVSVLEGLFTARLHRARKQAAVVALIVRDGGFVEYDYEVEHRAYGEINWVEKDSPIPAALLDVLGIDFFHEVVAAQIRSEGADSPDYLAAAIKAAATLKSLESLSVVSIHGSKVGDKELTDILRCGCLTELEFWGDGCSTEGMDRLKSLPRLRSLTLAFVKITDEGMADVGRLTSLESLNLEQNEISDRQLGYLAMLVNLKQLDLNSTPITGEGVRWPAALRKAQFWHSHLTDDGVKSLANCRQLEYLDVSHTRITDDGVEHMAALTAMRHLNLSGNRISSDGVKHLKDLQRLERLELERTFVDGEFDWPSGLTEVGLFDSCMTDAGLKRLAKCPKLRTISLSSTFTSDEGEAAFWSSRPNIQFREY